MQLPMACGRCIEWGKECVVLREGAACTVCYEKHRRCSLAVYPVRPKPAATSSDSSSYHIGKDGRKRQKVQKPMKFEPLFSALPDTAFHPDFVDDFNRFNASVSGALAQLHSSAKGPEAAMIVDWIAKNVHERQTMYVEKVNYVLGQNWKRDSNPARLLALERFLAGQENDSGWEWQDVSDDEDGTEAERGKYGTEVTVHERPEAERVRDSLKIKLRPVKAQEEEKPVRI